MIFKESKNLEFKERFSPTFLKTVSAFANGEGGEILFGVADDGYAVGIDDINLVKLQIENSINDAMDPRPEFDIKEEVKDDKRIINLTVYPGEEVPYLYQQKAYQRTDTASVPLNSRELQKLSIKGSRVSYEELVSTEDDLNFTVLEMALKEKLGLQNFDADVLRTLGLMKNGTLNRAAQLLADENNLKESAIDLVMFGDTEDVFLDRKTICGKSLITQYREALDFFDQWYKPYEQVVGYYRETRIKIPREAFREALANAIVHRLMEMPAAIRIAMYKDRIELTSPGPLPEYLTKEQFMEGKVSVLRNMIIAEVFHRLGIIEKFATGVKRIKNEYRSFPESPSFQTTDSYILITLPCVTYPDNEFEYEVLVVQLIKKHKSITRKEIEEITGLKKSRVGEILTELVKNKKIIQAGSGRSTHYQLPQD